MPLATEIVSVILTNCYIRIPELFVHYILCPSLSLNYCAYHVPVQSNFRRYYFYFLPDQAQTHVDYWKVLDELWCNRARLKLSNDRGEFELDRAKSKNNIAENSFALGHETHNR